VTKFVSHSLAFLKVSHTQMPIYSSTHISGRSKRIELSL